MFVFIGYSAIDEQLMNKHMSFEIQDSVVELQELLNKKLAPEVSGWWVKIGLRFVM